VDYDLRNLGPTNFEHLAQSLAQKAIGAKLSVFGRGPDGGREATWSGSAPSLNDGADWDGYGVVQAKHKADSTTEVAENLKWLKVELTKELANWRKRRAARKKQPDYLLFITNVALSPGAGGGKDQLRDHLVAKIAENKLPVRDFQVWDYDDVRTRLDDASDIRQTYSAWITPGDVIARLLETQAREEEEFHRALRLHAAKTLREDHNLNLRQSGSVSDQPTALVDVFIDLPSEATLADGSAMGVVELLRRNANTPNRAPSDLRGSVVVGGPGQGKSTATQFVAQFFRSEFLRGSSLAAGAEVSTKLASILERAESAGIGQIQARRWPIRIKLTDMADWFASNRPVVLEYVAHVVSEKSGIDVTTDALRSWLGSYPWLMIVDGLDEVPRSSNRDEVLSAIEDFLTEVDDRKADVFVIATTRPQGYSNEFSPDRYTHVKLVDLDATTAVAYARVLIESRHGQGTDTSVRAIRSLDRASKDPSTSLLFSSPLQVSILSVLVESYGDIPRTRWLLFSAYYDVISRREREKGGPLAALIRDYESEVHYFHHRVGFELQQRSAGAGDTSSFVSKVELAEIIRSRLIDQGHTAEEADALVDQFVELATDRLVFLAMLTSERVGFEIRSLQEYMAARHLVSLPESEIVGRLIALGPFPHWRNTLLFAIGHIFSDREHLKAEVLMICSELQAIGPASSLQLGSRLALEILQDGAANSQPKYVRALADMSVGVLSGPIAGVAAELAVVANATASSVISPAIESLDAAPVAVWVNRAIALDARRDLDRLDLLLEAAGPEARSVVLGYCWLQRVDRVLARFEPYLHEIDPLSLLHFSPPGFGQEQRREPSTRPDPSAQWFELFRYLFYDVPLGFEMQFTLDGNPSRLTYGGRGQFAEGSGALWSALSRIEFAEAPVLSIQKIAEFNASPSSDLLAEILDTMVQADQRTLRAVRWTGWVLNACVENAWLDGQPDGSGVSERFAQLAALTRSGALGDSSDWQAAEERWAEQGFSAEIPAVGFAPMARGDGFELDLPIWPGLRDNGLALAGARYTISLAHSSDDAKVLAAAAQRLAVAAKGSFGCEASVLAGLALFVWDATVSAFGRYADDEEAEGDAPELLLDPATALTGASLIAPLLDVVLPRWDAHWTRFLATIPEAEFAAIVDLDVARTLARGNGFGGMRSDHLAELLLARFTDETAGWEVAKLVLMLSPSRAITSAGVLQRWVGDSTEPPADVVAAVELAGIVDASAVDGALNALGVLLGRPDAVPFWDAQGFRYLRELIRHHDAQVGRRLTEVALDLATDQPFARAVLARDLKVRIDQAPWSPTEAG
jgi:hypothetical protein